MRSLPHTKLSRVRLGGTAAILAGLCYGAAGYLDRPGISGYIDAVLSVLSLAVPALFLRGLLGLRTQLPPATQTDFASSAGVAGFVMGCLGAVLGCFGAVPGAVGALSFLGAVPGTVGALNLTAMAMTEWWVLLFVGLPLMGLAAFLKGGRRLLGAVVSLSAALGWVSLLTDPAFSGVLLPVRSIHVAFAAAFCLSTVVWGAVLMVPHENR
jgi:hypothetical protein